MSTLSLLSTLLIASSFPIAAGDNNGPLAPRIARQQSNAASIRVNVKLIMVPVSVFDLYGRSVTGLDRENFRVFEGSKQVPIAAFSR